MSKWTGNGPCEKCGSSDGKWHDKKGGAYCFACERYFSPDNKQQSEKQSMSNNSRWSIEEIDGFPVADLTSRGITPETCRKYGVVQAMNPQTGQPDKHVFFPSGSGDGYKRRNLRQKSDMEIVGNYKSLFGQDKFKAGGKFLVITEGEIDALSVWQMWHERDKDYSVVSIPNGSGLGGIDRKDVYDYITSFTGVLLVFDQDEQGRAAIDRFAEIYGPSVAIKYVEFDAKDPNELLVEGRQGEFFQAVSRAKKYQPETIVDGADIGFDEISAPIQPGHFFQRFPEFSERLGGARKGELTTVLAPPGVGKSTFCAELGYDIIKRTGENVAWLFLEETTAKAAQRLIALDNDVPLAQYRLNPGMVGEEARRASYQNLVDNGRTKFIKLQHGMLNKERLLPLLRWYVYVNGVNYIILDHISLIFSADEGDNERKLIDNTMHDLAAFVTETGVGLIVVAHIKRMNQKIYAKDKENDAQWLLIDPDMARGSGAFEQLSWNLVALEPEYMENGEKGRTRIRILKNREHGSLGPTDIYRMNRSTGRLETLSEEF
jgi:twinkle protein